MSVVLATAMIVFVGAAPASAVDYYYELPYPAGEAYKVTQGPEGTYSHVGAYNEYAWDFGLPANYEVSAAQAGTSSSRTGRRTGRTVSR